MQTGPPDGGRPSFLIVWRELGGLAVVREDELPRLAEALGFAVRDQGPGRSV